jgi:electron transfer flavoprotein alpha subunit
MRNVEFRSGITSAARCSLFDSRHSYLIIKGETVIKNRDVIVVLESLDERAEEIHRGLLAEGGRIASLLGGSLVALLAEPSTHSSYAWVQIAKKLLQDVPFRLLLFAHTDKGRELAPMIAQSFNAPAVLDCFDIRFRNDNLCYARFVYNGQFEQENSFDNPPEIASLNLESLQACAGFSAAPIPFKKLSMRIPEIADGKKTIKTIPPDYRNIDIRYAKRILDIGAGCDQPALLELAEELSNLLEASMGTTRLVVDSGRISKTRMIGQTGKTASPELCLTLGVSGSPHHIAGIQKAGKLFAVNSDERAPVFGISDAGFAADLKSLLPKLISRIKQYRDEDLT